MLPKQKNANQSLGPTDVKISQLFFVQNTAPTSINMAKIAENGIFRGSNTAKTAKINTDSHINTYLPDGISIYDYMLVTQM